MAWVKGPNGLVIDVPDAIASGLIGDGTRGYAPAEAPKPRTPRKTPTK